MSEDDRGLEREIHEFTISFEPYVTELIDDILRHQREAMPEDPISEDPALLAGHRDAVAVGVAVVLSGIRVPDDLPTALPVSSKRTLRLSARDGVPLSTVRRRYRVSHAVVQDHFFRHADRAGTSMPALRRITEALFHYYDGAIVAVEEEYARQSAGAPVRVDHVQQARIERALAGARPDGLGYDLDGRHIAIVLDSADTDGTAETLAAELGAEVLASAAPTGETWIWLAAGELDADVVARRVGELLRDGHAGVSEREAGPHGFVGTHRKARIALRVGLMSGARVSRYRNVALEALAFGGEDVAADFARAELGRLADDSRRVAVLRETVQAYFASGSSTAATARTLGIAERTVTYRLRRAEELVGRPVSERRADLETALRLYGVLNVS